MLALLQKVLDWFKSLFWKEEMELTLVGLQYSGKTTFVNVIAVCMLAGHMIPIKTTTSHKYDSIAQTTVQNLSMFFLWCP